MNIFFQYALRNIAFRDTFSSVQIKQVVEFLKKIAHLIR